MPKKKGLQGTGRKQAQRFGGGHQKASEREPGRVFSSLSHHPFQNAGPLFSVATTYLVPRSFSIPAPGSGILGSGSPSSTNTEQIINPVKWRGTKICFAGRSKEWPGVLTDPYEAEILLKWPQEKTVLLLLLYNNKKKKLSSLSISSLSAYHSHILFPNPPPQRAL